MRLSIVTETYPPEINGVAMTLETLVKGMVGRGHEVEVVRPRQPEHDPPREGKNGYVLPGAAGESVYAVKGVPMPRYEGLRFGLPAKRRLIKHWTTNGFVPDTVHIATEGPLGITAAGAAKKLGIPLSSSYHTNFHQYGKHYGYGGLHKLVMRYLRYVHSKCEVTMVPSVGQMELLDADGFDNLMVLARGVDTELFDPARRDDELRKSWGADENTPVCVYVGRVAQEKNLPVTVKMFEAFREIEPDAKFVIVGDGPARAGLEKAHPEFIYAGMRRGEELAKYYASTDTFLFASITETFGNVVSEAMAAGVPTVCYDYAAGRTLIKHGENGLLAPYDDEPALIEQAREMARLGQAQREALGQAARVTANGITWDAIITDFENVLTEIAEKGVWSGEK